MTNVQSLKSQLRLWLLIPMLAILTVSGIVSYERALHFANQAFDRTLSRSVLALSDEVMVNDDNDILLGTPQFVDHLLKPEDGDRVYYVITSPDKKQHLGDRTFALPRTLPKANQLRFFNQQRGALKLRGVVYALPMSERPQDGNIMIAIAETTGAREAMVAEIVEEMLLPQVLIMLLASLVIEIGIRSVLKPVHAITAAIHQRSHRDLTPIHPASQIQELQPLLDAMNTLLERVRLGIQQQQQFIADASHQMRTPIAGLQTEAELALRQSTDPEQQEMLKMLVQSSSRLSHLTQRLLSLAKTDASILTPITTEPVSLKSVIQEVCQRYIDAAIKKQLDLSVAIETRDDTVAGDPLMLAEMLGNLVDNAIHYTPVQGLIEIRLETNQTQVLLQVIDSGIGIPEEARTLIFKRFHRLTPNQGNGCGLGLAIVAEIAAYHNAEIQVDRGMHHPTADVIGTRFTVKFQRYVRLPKNPGATSAYPDQR